MTKANKKVTDAQAQGAFADLAFHTIGWKAFQNMCAQVCEEKLGVPVSIFREAQDGGQDAVFLILPPEGETSSTGTVQVKHSSDAKKKLAVSDLTQELDHLKQLIIDGQADTYIFITNMTVDVLICVEN